MTTEFAKAVARAEQGMPNHEQGMLGARQQFVQATIEFLNRWVDKTTADEARQNPDLTKSLGLELSALKKAVYTLKSEMPNIVAELVDDDQRWPPGGSRDCYYETKPKKLQEAIQLAAWRLGPILEKYGYLSKNWQCEADQSGRNPPNARPVFPDIPEWSEDMITAIGQYNSSGLECESLRAEIRSRERQKAEEEARDLWNNA